MLSNCRQAVWILVMIGLPVLFQGGCAPARKHPQPEPVHALSLEKPFGPSISLAEFLNRSLGRQYPDHVPLPCPPDELGEYHVELAREQAEVHLAAGVRSHAVGPDGLAAGMDNGNILVWSDWPCPALTLPTASPVDLLAWDGVSPFLGASDARRERLHVFDLRLCAHVGSISSDEPIVVAALSGSGSWGALVDQGRRLRAGPVDSGPLHQAGVLRFHPLALDFSPREGLLFSVDQAGWLLHWTVPDLLVLDQALIPQGPFARAEFSGPHLLLEPVPRESGPGVREQATAPVIWDIPGAAMVSSGDAPASGMRLEAGVLTYQSPEKRWVRKMRLGRPQPRAWASPSSSLLRIRDVDGAFRCYCAVDGLLLQDDQCQAKDWKELDMDRAGRFQWVGLSYALADPIAVRNGQALFCRHLPGDRFFLWWAKIRPEEEPRPAPGADLAEQGRLPVRESLHMGVPPAWQAVPLQPFDQTGGNQ